MEYRLDLAFESLKDDRAFGVFTELLKRENVILD
jgi:hypothetical protein